MKVIFNNPTFAQHRFASFEVFSSTMGGYDVDIKQIDRGSFSAFMQQIQCGAVFINRFTTTRRLEVNGNPPPNLRTFGIPTTNCQPFVWRGQHSDGNSIQLYKASTELALITNPTFEAIDVSISEGDFNALSNQWGFPELNEIIAAGEMAICDPAVMHRLRKTLVSICQLVDSNPDELKQNTTLQNLVKYEVPYLVTQALISSRGTILKSAPSKRSHALKKAIEYIRSTSDEISTIGNFCQQTGIKERTLQRAFLETYGVTPKFYMQAFRLNDAYKALLHSNPDRTRITDIAIKLGYWHMSQFSADYRRLFGELPSATLRKH